jgi:hypothetical protein
VRNAGIFEEYDDLRERIYPRLLESAGFNAAILAANAVEAKDKIKNFEGQLHVALVDFDPGPHRPEERDTEKIIGLLRKKFGESVHIVTVDADGNIADGADMHLDKLRLPREFIEYIRHLEAA